VDTDRFAGRLREIREGAGLTQQQLAERAGMTKDGIAQLEQGRRKPSWETVLALSDALQVSCEQFREEPGIRPEPKRGRPPRATPSTPPAEDLEAVTEKPQGPSGKRPRGRPRKGK
jgi:transcriptional regulator with XRE-family HTH domain